MSGLAVAIVAGLAGMSGWGFSDFAAKRTIDQVGDVTTLFWSQLVGVVPLLVAFLVIRDVPTVNTWDPFWLLLFGVFSALSYLPLYAGFGKGQVSLLSPIFASYAVIVVVLSVVFFNEHVAGYQWVAIVIVMSGVLLISTDPRDLGRIFRVRSHETVRGLPEILAALSMYSVWLVLLDNFLHGRSWLFFMLIIRSVAALTLIVYARITKQPLRVGDRSVWPFLVAIGLCDVAAFSAVAWGFSASAHTSIVAVLSSCFSLPTILLAWVFLKERLTMFQVAAAGIILAGIALISVQ